MEKNKNRGNTLGDDIDIAAVIKGKITDSLYFYGKNISDELENYRTEKGVKIVDFVYLVDLCSHFKIDIEIIDLNKDDGLIGFCGMNRDKKTFIFVDREENEESRKNIVAHELAYCLLVEKNNILPKRFSGNIIFDKYKKDIGSEDPNINRVCNEFARKALV